MTIEEQHELEKKIGHRPSNEEMREWRRKKKQAIKKYCNMYMYSDVHPYEVVKVISKQTVEVRGMKHKQIVFPQDVHIGGFCAHTADNYNQKYEYESNKEAPVIRLRFSKVKLQWQSSSGLRFLMHETPIYFYDYNF